MDKGLEVETLCDLRTVVGVAGWLRDQLEEGGIRVSEIQERAKRAGINLGVMHRAATNLKVRRSKDSVEGIWCWYLT